LCFFEWNEPERKCSVFGRIEKNKGETRPSPITSGSAGEGKNKELYNRTARKRDRGHLASGRAEQAVKKRDQGLRGHLI